MITKTCTKCGETKPTSEFHKQADSPDGFRWSCKVCTKTSNDAWKTANATKVKEAKSRWQKENPDKARAIKAKYRAANKDKVKEISDKWRSANPEALRINKHNRRALVRASGGKLSHGLELRLFKLQRGKCACGCKQPLGDDYHLDHIMPLALGGTNTDDNIQLLKARCNLQKNAKHPADFMRQRGYLL